MSDSLQPCGLQHARLPGPSLSPGVWSSSCPLSCDGNAIQPSQPLLLPSPPAPKSGSFPVSWLFASNGQSIGSYSFSISPSNEYSGLISFRMDWFDLLAIQVTLESIAQGVSDRLSIATTVYFGFHLHGISFSILYFEHICVLKYEIGYLLI